MSRAVGTVRPVPLMLAGPVSAKSQKYCHGHRGKCRSDKKDADDWTPLTPFIVSDRSVMGKRADHEFRPFFPILSRQLRSEVLPLASGLSDSTGYSLGEVVADHTARCSRVRGLPSIEVDQTPVLVESCMCHPVLAFSDAGDLVPRHIATCREVGGHSRGRRAAEVENRTYPGRFKPGGLSSPVGRAGSASSAQLLCA